MSTKSNEINEKNLLTTSIKLENETDDDLIYENSLELDNNKDYYSTSTSANLSLSSTYKGKIEVTSKGRRKIFDGVRWQILCRRPECRKQTNKKSLCITHYKEEYESNLRSSSSWSNNLPSFQVPSYQQRMSFDHTKSRLEIEDQNNTITTTNIIDNDEQILFSFPNNRSLHDGHIKYLQNGRRFILKNRKWQSLCKYDNICRNTAKYGLLCIKHHELTEQKRRDTSKISHHKHQRLYSAILPNEKAKRLKANDFQISSSSVTEQFDINSNENNYTSNEPIDNNISSFTSKLPNRQIETSAKTNRSSDYSSFDKQNFEQKIDQSVQTDFSIPLCCILHQEDHSIYSSCQNHKSTSSIFPSDTKSEPKSFDTNFSI